MRWSGRGSAGLVRWCHGAQGEGGARGQVCTPLGAWACSAAPSQGTESLPGRGRARRARWCRGAARVHGGTGGLQVPGRRQREGRHEHLEVAEAGGRASLEGGPAGPGMCPVPGKILSWATVRVAGASLQSLRRSGKSRVSCPRLRRSERPSLFLPSEPVRDPALSPQLRSVHVAQEFPRATGAAQE